jgi:hypothetical protein
MRTTAGGVSTSNVKDGAGGELPVTGARTKHLCLSKVLSPVDFHTSMNHEYRLFRNIRGLAVSQSICGRLDAN